MKRSEFIELWLQALESGKYKQTENSKLQSIMKIKRTVV